MTHGSIVLTAFLRLDNHRPEVHLGAVPGSGRGDLHVSWSDSPSAVGLAKLVRRLKRERQWKLVFMHTENLLLHPSRNLCATPLTFSKTSGAVIIPPPPVVILGTPKEMVKVRRPLGPVAVVCHLGRWTTQHEDDRAPLESIKRVPIWEGAEWSRFQSILARPLREPKLTTNEVVHTMHVER